MQIQFFLPMMPPTVTHQEKKVSVKNGKPIFFEPPELKDARAKFKAHLSKHIPKEPLTGAITLICTWCFSSSNKHPNGQPKITKPDTDNLQKLFKDVMTQCGFWKDDAQVYREIIEKFYSDVPGIRVYVSNE